LGESTSAMDNCGRTSREGGGRRLKLQSLNYGKREKGRKREALHCSWFSNIASSESPLKRRGSCRQRDSTGNGKNQVKKKKTQGRNSKGKESKAKPFREEIVQKGVPTLGTCAKKGREQKREGAQKELENQTAGRANAGKGGGETPGKGKKQ